MAESKITAISTEKLLDDNVKHLQLVNAMTSNNTDEVLNAIFKINASNNTSDTSTSYGSPLHLVVSICPKHIIENVVGVFCSNDSAAMTNKTLNWINVQNLPDKETPLHIVSKLSRNPEILELLLQIPNVNDTLRDVNGHTAHELATDESLSQIFESKSFMVKNIFFNYRFILNITNHSEYKQEFVDLIITSFKTALSSGDYQPLDQFFSRNLRAQEYLKLGWVDINASLNATSDRSLLHLAAKADNLELVVWAIKYGADPNVKDGKGRKPIELAKMDKVKDILKHAKAQAPITTASLAQATSSTIPLTKLGIREAPVLKGMLLKWTNYKDGYQRRYFVLEGGVFSYFHDVNDYPAVCRGSVSTLSINAFFPDAKKDPSRFDVTGSGNIKYSLQARSPADAKKWVWSLLESRVWMSDVKSHSSQQSLNRLAVDGFSKEPQLTRSGSSKSVNNLSPNGDTLSIIPTVVVDTKRLSATPPLARAVSTQKFGMEQSIRTDAIVSPDFLSSYVSDGSTPEIRRFLTLLKTEFKIQQETVQSAVNVFESIRSVEPKTQNMLKPLPNLLAETSKHIEDILVDIIQYYNNRESMWEHKLKRATETHKRLEDVVQKLAMAEPTPHTIISSPSKPVFTDLPILDPPVKMTVENSSDYGSNQSDEFFDAHDNETFFETVLGLNANVDNFSTNIEDIPEEQRIVSTVSNGFLSVTEFEDDSKPYISVQPYRTKLPLDPTVPKPALQVWSFLKSAIGKDLSKVTLPVLFNEPISMLQRLCEDVEYIELLALAGQVGSLGFAPLKNQPSNPAIAVCTKQGLDYQKLVSLTGEDCSLLRLMLIAGFAVSNYSTTPGRTSKPFNPMLGETFEFIHMDKKFRYLSEQVCHHPPISASFSDGPDFAFWTEINVRSKFWGKSLEVQPLGTCHVSLPVYDKLGECVSVEHYSWKKVTTCVNNLIMGTLTIEHYGDMVIKNHRTGEECTVTFKPKDSGGWFGSKEPTPFAELIGTVKDSKGQVRYEVKGTWEKSLSAYPIKPTSYPTKPISLWEVTPRPPTSSENFNFTSFAMLLNQTAPTLETVLPLTDSRRRPDQRSMEEGKWDDADVNKDKMEQGQRARRKVIVAQYEETKIPNGPPAKGIEMGEAWWSPRWFVREIEKDTNEPHWRFNGEYWKIRKSVANGGNWPHYVESLFEMPESSSNQ
ncbi:hypothetical protein HDV02_000012 [Globomyces sp. JEL0801]|nr:hypothetical protein HDV02_000012 [Globomyces sp. JEL0801]